MINFQGQEPKQSNSHCTYFNTAAPILILWERGKVKIFPDGAVPITCLVQRVERPDLDGPVTDLLLDGTIQGWSPNSLNIALDSGTVGARYKRRWAQILGYQHALSMRSTRA